MKNWLYLMCGLTACGVAQAQIYKHVDADGRVTYSNIPIKGAEILPIEPPPSSPAAAKPKATQPTPANFPKVDKAEQKQRDDKRRQILEEELAAERKALEEAKQAYAEGEKNPEVFKTTVPGKDGKPVTVTRRNVAKYQEKMQQLQDNVSLHEKNIELLQQELANLN